MGRGMLTFKGDAPKKKKKKKTKHTSNYDSEKLDEKSLPNDNNDVALNHSAALQKQQSLEKSDNEAPSIKPGTGKVTSSGAVVTGIGTKFVREMGVGDAMIVGSEMRVVTMCLSDTSCGISSGFSSSLTSPVEFSIIRKPPQKADALKKKQALDNARKEVENSAFGKYRGSKELVYRQRTEHGSYRIQKAELGQEKSRTELLTMRSSKTSDKYC
mmetsp:Transcript_29253/g.44241  ORF Transcript_29253/g.44241 Transcript_29253/m.44241 type:complete len:214 (-) Transcript_29253:2164-2805(-)